MKHCCSVNIQRVSAGGVVNFGGAFKICPITMEKVVEGSGGPDVATAAAGFLDGALTPAVDEGTVTEDS
ncbi:MULTISPECIES: spore germination protein [Bacillus]|uniref:spore germination protein n=1 Tax=Bacillus TaxID=1386 RepID=UPI00128D1A40|nr:MULTISPECIES: spore germination protein [Bacillus]MCJ2145088.1 spore germination protein [Bacillus sp. B19-2]MDN5388220.1 spore germination protein [Bacillus sp. LB7]MEC1020788.1 spore germination protein [Bacillus paralicheniformis]MEC1025866.1 spore germination protein [Bacillus paralicheniformis]MEC1036373.1 spore germination protein [Bacillus paralicheniformis]